MKRIINIFKYYEWIFLMVAFASIITFSIIYINQNNIAFSIVEIIATLLGLLAASLNMKTKRYAFIFYSVYALVYGISAVVSKQYGEAILNLGYCVPLYLFTIYKLYFSKASKEKKDDNFTINNLKWWHWLILIAIIPVITLGWGSFLKYVLHSNLPYINALATACAIEASFLASKTNICQWYFWLAYSFVLIYLWLSNFQSAGAGISYLILNVIYVIINLYGLISWILILKKQKKE